MVESAWKVLDGSRRTHPMVLDRNSSSAAFDKLRRDLALALQYHEAGRLDEAEAAYRELLARLSANETGARALRAKAHYSFGVLLKARGRVDEAALQYSRVVAIEPNDCNALNNLGCIFVDQGRLSEAATYFERVLSLRPDAALVHFNLGNVFKDQGKLEAAARSFQRAIAIKPDFAGAWCACGQIRELLGDREGAIAAFIKALEADAKDRHGAALHLARLRKTEVQAPPSEYIRALFDRYAPRFDRALVQELAYRGPELLLSAVESACRVTGHPMHFTGMLDLGCGTGLVGETFRRHVDYLAGVDISSGLIAQARSKSLYDRLETEDIMNALMTVKRADRQYDLVTAAEVFIYFADLSAVMAGVAGILAAPGIFAFTCETHDGDGVLLHDTNRFAQSESYIRAVLADAGLRPVAVDSESIRMHRGAPAPALIVVAKKIGP